MMYLIALLSLAMGLGAVFTLVESFPVKWLYYHFKIRKWVNWTLLLGSLTYELIAPGFSINLHNGPPLLLMTLGLLLAYKAHQSNWFQAINFPTMAEKALELPLQDEASLAVIEWGGTTRCYPLDYVIHHHIINDHFGDKTVALTYCAMCRSIIPFEVSDIGPLFVGSFKNANMIVADQKTQTFFQQETFQSVVGPLHPHALSMIPFQVLDWKQVKSLSPMPEVVLVHREDLKPFRLPMPGVWKKVMSTELTPGLSSKDTTFPSKTRIIGIRDPQLKQEVAYLKAEVLNRGKVVNDSLHLTLLVKDKTVVAFKHPTSDNFDLSLGNEGTLLDNKSETRWNVMGKFISGSINKDLTPVSIQDEYWFAWKKFHSQSTLIRLKSQNNKQR